LRDPAQPCGCGRRRAPNCVLRTNGGRPDATGPAAGAASPVDEDRACRESAGSARSRRGRRVRPPACPFRDRATVRRPRLLAADRWVSKRRRLPHSQPSGHRAGRPAGSPVGRAPGVSRDGCSLGEQQRHGLGPALPSLSCSGDLGSVRRAPVAPVLRRSRGTAAS
jgi:hypothetical protein